MEKFEINPFDRSALKEYKLLAGRNNEFRKIRFILRNSSKQENRIKSVLISGSRGVGKTSFLNLIENESLDNNIIPVRINLTQTNSINPNEFFWNLFSQTINTVLSLNLLEGKSGAIDSSIQKILHGDGLSDPANWVFKTPILRRTYLNTNNPHFEFDLFVDDLKLIRSQIINSKDERFNSKTKIVFLIDESQNIYSEFKIIQDIRFIIQNQDIGIGFIFAGDSTFQSSNWEEVFGGSIRDFEIVNLNYFNDVQDVADYFKKSLDSIGWTSNEIEESLFYRFKLACRQIFQLTSGNPSWINTIASKMFDRCMTGEASILKFDRQAQLDVKQLLESSRQIDKEKLDFIDNLSPKYGNWLIEIFACELQILERVYFYAKFIYKDNDFLTLPEFKNFCSSLVEMEIIKFIDDGTAENSKKQTNDLKRQYIAFNYHSDTIKQWLQINTDGKFRFSLDRPSVRFVKYINDQLTTEKVNSQMVGERILNEETAFRLSTSITEINNNTFEVIAKPYEVIFEVYQACKRLQNSRDKQCLYISLKNLISLNNYCWNVYNYDDKDHFIKFRESPKTIEKISSVVASFNDEKIRLSLEIEIDNLEKPDLVILQKLILKSGDKKKFGIILDDKNSELIDSYVKNSDLKSSVDIATFFYELFVEGYDLSRTNLNNSAYVFIINDEIEKAYSMLNEAKNQTVFNSSFSNENDSTLDLVFYNFGIIDFKKNDYSQAIINLEKVIQLHENNDKIDGSAGVLLILEMDNSLNINLVEIKEHTDIYTNLNCFEFAKKNIAVLKEYQAAVS